ncbi:E3 ubiquitin-protein ligase RFWD3 [Apostasia shenzhenica]|uniref:RING-type E3 ubiquitin transferase n=1 Tax=Apostasia shenzhenica TaxID=1088818 RepID=A0A2H9ZY87_9ASPA|nr:E3 ubiquitin-protein ligase RFWD3 [Apostasia shenzhenica]
MASRRTASHSGSDRESADGETDEDYDPDDDNYSDEEYAVGEVNRSPVAESPEVEVLEVAYDERDGGEDEVEEDEEVVVVDEAVFEMVGSTSRDRECDDGFSVAEGQRGIGSDPSLLPSCPICFTPWSPDGSHRVCCIPCGHVYGRSCLERWIQECGKNMAKEMLSLRKNNECLKLEKARLLEEINKSKKHSIDREGFKGQKRACLGVAARDTLERKSGHLGEGWFSVPEPVFENRIMPQNFNLDDCSHHRCVLKNEFLVDDARALGIDACSKILIISGKKLGCDGEHVLSKFSLLGQHEREQIPLPSKTGAVRDLCILPSGLVLLASLGKKLSLLSMSSNNLVLSYDLPVPAWSCSGDVNEPYHVYTGLQNGILLMFDIRQTARCLNSVEGLSRFPIHTICSLQQKCGTRKVLTASSVGPCLWDVTSIGERPFLIPEVEDRGICVSLACGSSSSDIVASFRPKILLPNDSLSSQTTLSSSSPAVLAAGKLGCHVSMKRVNETHFQKVDVAGGYVSEVRMSKSAIICTEGNNPLFAYGDESYRGMCIWDLPSFQVHSRHPPHQYPILDLKYSSYAGSGFLGCISENRLQVFTYF